MVILKMCGCKAWGHLTRVRLLRFLRTYCTETKHTKKWKKQLHIYNYSFNWGSSNELAHIVARDVILNEDGLVVINKPYGIGKEPPVVNEKRAAIENRLNTALPGEKYFYMNDLLPILARNLGYPYLEIIKIPERYTSGVTILSASKDLSDHVKNCIQKGKHQGLLDTYRLLCVGRPTPSTFTGKVGVQFEKDVISGGSQPVLVRSWSENQRKRQDVSLVTVEHSIVQEAQLASLVEVKPSRTRAHFMRFYMAYMLSPILGDNLYGSRVQKIGTTPIAISPFSDRAKMAQRLEEQMLHVLDLERRDECFIPAHVHLNCVTIPNFKGNGESLTIKAPLPEYFQWSCKRLLIWTAENERTEMKC